MTLYYEADGIALYHGDCLEVTEWHHAEVLITDPPYGMNYISGKTVEKRPVAGDQDAHVRDAALEAWGDRPALVFGTWQVPRPKGTRQVITWHKAAVGPGLGDLSMPWGNATEEIYVLGEGWHGKRRQNVIATKEQRGGASGLASQTGHPTPKPIDLLHQLIECAPPGTIADPFAGSGSTLLAARLLGRPAIGIEMEEKYCELIATRLAQGLLF